MFFLNFFVFFGVVCKSPFTLCLIDLRKDDVDAGDAALAMGAPPGAPGAVADGAGDLGEAEDDDAGNKIGKGQSA